MGYYSLNYNIEDKRTFSAYTFFILRKIKIGKIMFEVYGAVTVNDWMYQNMFAKFYAGVCWIMLHKLVEFNNG